MSAVDTIRVRRDTAAIWTSVNPILRYAEIGLETDTRKIKFGDGVTAWTGLAYSYTGSGTVTGVTGTAPIASSGGTAPAISITAASGAAAGSMSAVDKTKLDAITGTNTGDQTTITGNAGTATKLATARTLGITGDLVWTSPSFDGSGNVTAAGTLATVNATTGTFGSATKSLTVTANGKGLITSISEQTVTPAVGSITGLGTGVGTALGIAVGSAGAPITFNGALGTPSSGTLTNCTFPTLNQNTTGSAATLTTGRTLAITGDLVWTSPSFNGSGNVTAAGTLATVNSNVGSFGSATQTATFTVNAKGLTTAASNVTITPAVGSITGLGTGVATALAINIGSAGAFVALNGALGTPSSGTLTNCTFPTLNQNTTGSAATLTTSRNIDGQAFNGSANITVIAPGTHAATTKATPVDADELPLVDSAASNVLAKLTWANVKATLKTYFDTLYPAYSTGTFTPALTLGGANTGITYSTQTARYTKRGRDVRVEGYLILSNKGSSTGGIAITGLPFTSNSSLPYALGTALFSASAAISSPVALIVNNAAGISFYNQSATSFVQITDANLTNLSEIYFSIEYST